MIKQKLFWYKVFFINIAVNWTEKVNQVFFRFISLHVPKNKIISRVETWIGRSTLFLVYYENVSCFNLSRDL